MGGSTLTTQNGVYGTKGVAAAANAPGSRGGPAAWKDASGKFWMFGGNGYTSATNTLERLSDLWKYDPVTNEWTWIMGSDIAGAANNLGNYGTRGVEAATSMPGGRSQPSATWKDAQGNFFFFGGYGYATSTTQGVLNDIWKFNPVNNRWTWLKGQNIITSNAVIGTQGTPDPNNTPGTRAQIGQWVDNDGNIWIFAGSGRGSTGTTVNYLSDVWRLTPPPCGVTITASRPLTLCLGDSVILKANTAATGVTYEWYEGVTLVGNDTAYVAKTAGSYTVKINSITCNTVSPAVSVVVNPLPAVTVNLSPATAAICIGGDTMLIASGAVSYVWTPAAGLNTTTNDTVRANPNATTTYTVEGTGANGCIGVASRVVTVNPLPVITVTPATAVICTGSDTALTANGGSTYTWSPATYTGSGTTIRANPTATTTYTVTGTDANGCRSTATRIVTVNPLPVITISPATAVICAGKDTALTANGGAAYGWLPVSGLNTPSGATVRASPATTTIYTVTGMDANGCKNTASREVTVNSNPIINITPATAAICLGKDTTFSASGAATYSWSPAGGLNTATGATVIADPTITTSYVVTGTDANGCIGNDTQTVIVKALPIAAITPPGPVAFCEFDSILLTAYNVTGAGNAFQWKHGATNVGNGTDQLMAKVAGSYTVTVLDTATCSATSNATIVAMNARPSINMVIDGPTEFCRGSAVALNIPKDTGIAYQWMRDGSNIPYAELPFYQVFESGIYTVIATHKHIANCGDTSQAVTVKVHPLPNPAVYVAGDRLYTDNIYTIYQWYYMGQPINSATSWQHTATMEGTYKVIVTDSNGCSNESINRTMVHTGLRLVELTEAIILYPNPANDHMRISCPVDVNIHIYNMAGQQLIYTPNARDVNITSLSSGLYLVKITDKEGALLKIEKMIKQ